MALIDHVHETRCPHCGKRAEVASNASDDAPPEDGNVSLCIGCGRWGIFASSAPGGVRKTTAREAAAIATDPTATRVRWAWLMTRAKLQRKPETKQ